MTNFTPEEISEILAQFFDVTGKRQYIGARYVPIFGRKDEQTIQWDGGVAPYEPLTIVLYQGNSYTSRTYVPTGIDISNQYYWALTGNYNAQVEAYREEVTSLSDRVTTNENDIDALEGLLPKTDFSDVNTVKKYIDDTATQLANDIDAVPSKSRDVGCLVGDALWVLEVSPSIEEQTRTAYARAKEVGFDFITLLAHIDENGVVAESDYYFDYVIENAAIDNIICDTIKFHFTSFTSDTKMNLYYREVIRLCNKYKDNLSTVYIFNEEPSAVYTYRESCLALINELKIMGYNVGFSMGIYHYAYEFKQYYNDFYTSSIFNNLDVLGINYYPSISLKGSGVSYEDFKYNIHESFISNFRNIVNKPIEITEFGIIPYWECASDPGVWNLSRFPIRTSSHQVITNFWKSMLEGIENSVNRITGWYLYMFDSNNLEVIKTSLSGKVWS